jgi:AraC-like DNA-binding protein
MALWISFKPYGIRFHLTGKREKKKFIMNSCQVMGFPYMMYGNLLNDILCELRTTAIWKDDMLKTHVIRLLIVLLRNMDNLFIDSHNDRWRRQWKKSLVREIITYIEENYQKNPSLNDIAHTFCFSASHVNDIFKSVTGKTIIYYYNDVKIVKARELLANTTMQIKSIALHLGYCDQFHFSKTFKRKIGLSPSDYRRSLNIMEQDCQ